MFAALQWVGARSEQGLSQVAATQYLELAQDGESEMPTGGATLRPLKDSSSLSSKKPHSSIKPLHGSTSALLQVRGDWQRSSVPPHPGLAS